MPLWCTTSGTSFSADYNKIAGVLRIAYDESNNQTEDPSDIQPDPGVPPAFAFESGGSNYIGAQVAEWYRNVGVSLAVKSTPWKIPKLDSVSPDFAAGFSSAKALIKIENATWQHQRYDLYTDSNPTGGVLLDSGLYWHYDFDSESGSYTGDFALGLIGWKFVSGNLQPYVLSSQAVSSAAKIGNYFVIDASGFIDAYLSAKNKFVGFSFYVSGAGFDIAYTAGDDPVAVGMSILGQYSDRSLSFCGRAAGDSSITHFTGAIDHYKYTWENPAIGLICCHFAASDITINQTELLNYDLIPSDIGN